MKAGQKMFFLLATLALAAAGRIRSDDIHTLHFEAGRVTAPHRGKSFPQLNNLADPGRQVLQTATCYRTTKADAPWDCDFDGPAVEDYEVACVPWAAEGDAYVVDGGCFLRYRHTPPAPAPSCDVKAQVQKDAAEAFSTAAHRTLMAAAFLTVMYHIVNYWFVHMRSYMYHRYCPAGCSRHCSECRYIITQWRTGLPGATQTGPYTHAMVDRIIGWIIHLPAGAPFPYRARVRDVPGGRWIPSGGAPPPERPPPAATPDAAPAASEAAPAGPSGPPACADPSCTACPRAGP